jgi:hypothetical protein
MQHHRPPLSINFAITLQTLKGCYENGLLAHCILSVCGRGSSSGLATNAWSSLLRREFRA